ncbi:hypothetical protein [Dechloromonas sp. A34]|uniref:hypothetical protein n=1 Tax=Dechloromonas sp. A34 TaxID=447588 RepID=UPI0022498F13|nr:hypothetical protein [Dechloromonas sp. A34]
MTERTGRLVGGDLFMVPGGFVDAAQNFAGHIEAIVLEMVPGGYARTSQSFSGVGVVQAGAGEAPGGGGSVDLPAAWQSVELPAGYICPLLGQVALARGEAVAYDAASKRLTIGGRVLIGTAGKVFAFASKPAADMWESINRARVARELELLAGLTAGAVVAFKAGKVEGMQARAARITANAAKTADPQKRAALTAEAGFYATKWS